MSKEYPLWKFRADPATQWHCHGLGDSVLVALLFNLVQLNSHGKVLISCYCMASPVCCIFLFVQMISGIASVIKLFDERNILGWVEMTYVLVR